ncbi:MAG: RNA polymerase factor sigma-54 [Chlamydiales bacterium]|nr:RNA polymerase factor sigma-54 [Chlamydiales bacterium]NCF70563.1 RNA polymerase factor sigma-54 [Chlamydiales bacterium]
MAPSFSININQKQSQSLKQTQRLIMSPQMQQAINLLQLPVLELNSIINNELENNPILEVSDAHHSDEVKAPQDSKEEKDLEEVEEIHLDEGDFEVLQKLGEEFGDQMIEQSGFVTKKTAEEEKLQAHQINSIQGSTSLFTFLTKQAHEVFEKTEDLHLSEIIIGNLDKQGFFSSSLAEIAALEDTSEEKLESILKVIQTFEPFGVGARNFQESLLIQLSCLKKKDTLAFRIVDEFYQELLHNKIPQIAKKLKKSLPKVMEAIEKDIAKLDFHPGNFLLEEKSSYITPDVYFVSEGASLRVEINEEEIPFLKINSKYLTMLEDQSVDKETKEYILQKISSGKWLLQNIHHRNNTLKKIAELLAEKQHSYLTSESGKLTPLTMKTVAQELELHESTIARAVANKYASCLRGLKPLRSFFTNSFVTDQGEDISSHTVKKTLLEIIDQENKSKPLSDQAISNMLNEQGIPCARRTVAKYRRELNIGNTSQRKKFN